MDETRNRLIEALMGSKDTGSMGDGLQGNAAALRAAALAARALGVGTTTGVMGIPLWFDPVLEAAVPDPSRAQFDTAQRGLQDEVDGAKRDLAMPHNELIAERQAQREAAARFSRAVHENKEKRGR